MGEGKKCRSELKGLSHRVPEARNAFGFCGLSEELPRQREAERGRGRRTLGIALSSQHFLFTMAGTLASTHTHTRTHTQGHVTAKMLPDVALCGKVAASFNAKQLNWILAGRSLVAALLVYWCVCVCVAEGGLQMAATFSRRDNKMAVK